MEKIIALIILLLGVITLAFTLITTWHWMGSNRSSRTLPMWRLLLFFDVLLICAFISALVLMMNDMLIYHPLWIALIGSVVSAFVFIAVRTGSETSEEMKKTLMSAEEKEVLLKELHHRVKNNLQIIISILKLQRMKPIDKISGNIIAECESRIFSMALIHENLYKSRDFSSINFRTYINHLLREIIYVNEEGKRGKIKTNINCRDVHFKIDKLIPLGLIMNELAVNSIRHAFRDSQDGIIEIEGREDGNEYIIRFSDNGIGFDESQVDENDSTLGLELVRTLVEQLEGDFQIINNKGATFLLRIPMN